MGRLLLCLAVMVVAVMVLVVGVAWLLAPLSAGASLVLCRHVIDGRDDVLARRAADERVTATLGLRVEGIRELGRPVDRT